MTTTRARSPRSWRRAGARSWSSTASTRRTTAWPRWSPPCATGRPSCRCWPPAGDGLGWRASECIGWRRSQPRSTGDRRRSATAWRCACSSTGCASAAVGCWWTRTTQLALAALCRRCAGLPLALELVAAQLTSLPPGDVLDQLDDVALAGDDELRQVAEAGCAQLADDEAAVFRRLAVLDGPASLTTIRGVVVDDLVPPLRVVRILGELADRGLVTVRRGGPRLLYAQDDDLRRVASRAARGIGRGAGHLPPTRGDRPRPAAGRSPDRTGPVRRAGHGRARQRPFPPGRRRRR